MDISTPSLISNTQSIYLKTNHKYPFADEIWYISAEHRDKLLPMSGYINADILYHNGTQKEYKSSLEVVNGFDYMDIVISPDTIKEGDRFILSVKAENSEIEWYRDEVFIPEYKEAELSDAGEYTLKLKHLVDNSELIIKHNLEVIPYTMAEKSDIKIKGLSSVYESDSLKLDVDINSDYEYTVKWYFNELEYNEINIDNVSKDNEGIYKVVVKFEDNSELSDSIFVNVLVDDRSECVYTARIHELSHRNSAFIHINYWELDEIKRIKESGGNWREQLDNMKYRCASVVIDKWLNENPDSEIEVQESRNGYILTKEFFKEES